MNFDTGVISASSLSIGAWPNAGPGAPPIARMIATTSVMNRFIYRLLSVDEPSFGLLHRSPPAIVPRRPHQFVPSRLEAPLEGPAPAHLLSRAPDTGPESGQVCGAARGRLDDAPPQHRHAQEIGLELAEEVVRSGAAVDPEPFDRDPGVGGHRFQDVAALERDRLERGSREVRAGGSAREPDDCAARIHVPVG